MVHMKLKVVALAISVEYLIFTIFFDVSQLSYKLSNVARANKTYAMGLRVNASVLDPNPDESIFKSLFESRSGTIFDIRIIKIQQIKLN